MSATTPQKTSETNLQRSNSTTRKPLSRPVTPLRPSSRSSLRDSARQSHGESQDSPLEFLVPALGEFSDSMADLEANMMHLQLMHESLSRFSENFASFLYGLNMNAFCVDFPEAPIADSFQRANRWTEQMRRSTMSDLTQNDFDAETTFMTTDTSFVEHPPQSSKNTQKFGTSAQASRTAANRGRIPQVRGSGSRSGRGSRGGGLPRSRGGSVR